MNVWLVLAVIFYPIAVFLPGTLTWPIIGRLDRMSALAAGLLVFIVLWLYALPRDLGADIDRLAMPFVAYLGGLIVAAVLMALTKKRSA